MYLNEFLTNPFLTDRYVWDEYRQTADLSSTESAPSSPSVTVTWSPEASPSMPQGPCTFNTLCINIFRSIFHIHPRLLTVTEELPIWYLGTPFNDLRASIPSTSSNNTISPSQPSPAIQQYLAGPYVDIGNVFVLDESNGAQDVTIENGAISPHELGTTRLQQPLSVQTIIGLHPSTVTVPASQVSPHSTEFLSGHSPVGDESLGPKGGPTQKQDPEALRKTVMNHYRTFTEEHVVLKMFSKQVKDKVASLKNLEVSARKRKHAATFECLINGCDRLFTRKANLESELI